MAAGDVTAKSSPAESAPVRRKPPWLKVRLPGSPGYKRLKADLRGLSLHTVCEEARCPNIGECWGGGTATIMLLGDVCTRGCRFCAVRSGNPGGRVDETEPLNVAEALARWGLDYVVLTTVDRDDLPDGGAGHVARTVQAIKRRAPALLVEALVSDFQGDRTAVAAVARSGLEVFAHNVETVERMQGVVRDARCGYRQSLDVLEHARQVAPEPVFTKSSIMLGVGETDADVRATLEDLRGAGVDFVTIGQYLRPSSKHLPVTEYVSPERFEAWRAEGEAMGFLYVASAPLVRSSYRAGELFVRQLLGRRRADGHTSEKTS